MCLSRRAAPPFAAPCTTHNREVAGSNPAGAIVVLCRQFSSRAAACIPLKPHRRPRASHCQMATESALPPYAVRAARRQRSPVTRLGRLVPALCVPWPVAGPGRRPRAGPGALATSRTAKETPRTSPITTGSASEVSPVPVDELRRRARPRRSPWRPVLPRCRLRGRSIRPRRRAARRPGRRGRRAGPRLPQPRRRHTPA